MKKTQMALAAVALVASTAAMADVTVSGSIDTGVGSYNSAAKPGRNNVGFQEGQSNGGSALTISGSDDLGGGMKASFTLQTGFDAGSGTVSNGGNAAGNSVFNRQSNSALSGGFGTITLGGQARTSLAQPALSCLARSSVHLTFLQSSRPMQQPAA
ncbi:MAG: porin, partial [Betaproteobacteria bacterium]